MYVLNSVNWNCIGDSNTIRNFATGLEKLTHRLFVLDRVSGCKKWETIVIRGLSYFFLASDSTPFAHLIYTKFARAVSLIESGGHCNLKRGCMNATTEILHNFMTIREVGYSFDGTGTQWSWERLRFTFNWDQDELSRLIPIRYKIRRDGGCSLSFSRYVLYKLI